MEFYKSKLFGGEVNILFTGENYFFFHGFYGVICVAQRDEKYHFKNSGKENEQWREKFTLYSGHRDGNIEKESFALAKQIITKNERRFVKAEVEYEEVVTDLNKCLVTVSYNLNRFG